MKKSIVLIPLPSLIKNSFVRSLSRSPTHHDGSSSWFVFIRMCFFVVGFQEGGLFIRVLLFFVRVLPTRWVLIMAHF